MSTLKQLSDAPPKVDPETLVLRGKPPAIIRFKRGLIIAMVALGVLAIIGVTWIALRPATLDLIGDTETRINAENKRPPEALADGPQSYADIPKLGPKLPGDLGKPILDKRRQMATENGDPIGTDQDALNAAQAAQAERQRLAAEQRKVREAGIIVSLSQASSATNEARLAAANPIAQTPTPPNPENTAINQTSDPNAQGRKIAFAKAGSSDEVISMHRLQAAPSPWTLSAGSVISASLITGLNSDLPGLVTAQVTENVTDTITGRIILIPQGSRLIGEYDSVITFGQSRALLVWQRLILPDGSYIRIDNAPASDTSGYAGLSDQIDNHSWRLLKGIALSTLLGVGTELTFGDSESDLVRALRESTQQNADRAGQQLVGKNLTIQPTIKIRPGFLLRVLVHKDLVLRPWPHRSY
ncbi:MAG: conjugal transfer protein TrbI [Sphingopyxis sp.]|nr:MAG: conjugal transfer protein TrbI [Sphingopyxis sp.]